MENWKSYHFHLVIDWELERIRQWQWTTLKWCSAIQAWNILYKAKEEWKKYRSWCDNMTEDWRCWGHEK